ncbi:hypothetical protein A8H39_40905 [Paraburkholderia fungorum]|nr:hypothetical protein A8H39_40905 [Paraburkholderia fungorum]
MSRFDPLPRRLAHLHGGLRLLCLLHACRDFSLQRANLIVAPMCRPYRVQLRLRGSQIVALQTMARRVEIPGDSCRRAAGCQDGSRTYRTAVRAAACVASQSVSVLETQVIRRQPVFIRLRNISRDPERADNQARENDLAGFTNHDVSPRIVDVRVRVRGIANVPEFIGGFVAN